MMQAIMAQSKQTLFGSTTVGGFVTRVVLPKSPMGDKHHGNGTVHGHVKSQASSLACSEICPDRHKCGKPSCVYPAAAAIEKKVA